MHLKITLSTLLITFFTSLTFAQYSTDRYYNLDSIVKYKVKSSYQYKVKPDGSRFLLEQVNFDSIGNIIEILRPETEEWTRFTYNSDNQLIQQEQYAATIDFYELTEFYYNKKGYLTKEVVRDSTQITYIKENKYKGGLCIESHKARVNSKNNYEITWYYQYDDQGRLEYEGTTKGSKNTQFIYNENGLLINFLQKSGSEISLNHEFYYQNNFRVGGYLKTKYSQSAYIITYDEKGFPLQYLDCDDCDRNTSQDEMKVLFEYEFKK
ncbi:hypothetical protein SAMN05216474_0456 [Lishizhenia tianjinensis]|uniref:YD repeat-containing protein n=1 Tax=Lishizhenia tianjinensis TaxID=477690 RepID=A0A1I6XV82_9FLAO|nr:hypothetical protein [Lishizhenia tianjinensis]SFT41923.1 hypothetical protein SAMN05216474_0456 [Lishizhenia tianjinensis]